MAARYMDSSWRGGVLRRGRATRTRTGRIAEVLAERSGGRFGNGVAAIAYGTRSRCGAIMERQNSSVRGQT